VLFPISNARHYTFMLEGLAELEAALGQRQAALVLRRGTPVEVALELGQAARLIVCDRGYLRHQRQWREEVAQQAPCAVVQVESDLVVPVEAASQKVEHAARTLRPKLHRQFEAYLQAPAPCMPLQDARQLGLRGEDIRDPHTYVQGLKLDFSVPAVSEHFRGGAETARQTFAQFLDRHLKQYADHRNQPQTDDVSHMSKYLHFGQVSPVYLLTEARRRGQGENVEAFVEELLVRRELAANFCYFEKAYDEYRTHPEWARETLEVHKEDPRPHVCTREELKDAQTEDRYWNAAMLEMRHTGYMHNYMRMYWGKQLLRYTRTPLYAYQTALYLNNRYFLDGCDCNSYANVAWLFGRHDRGWTEREVFGKVRPMLPSGLKRKFDREAYVRKVERLTGRQVPGRDPVKK
jgi:deoxyribodipyrimidine photo-lyase